MGCDVRMRKDMRKYLRKTALVVTVDRWCKVQLKHDDGAMYWWGHGALQKCLSSDEVDRKTVILSTFLSVFFKDVLLYRECI